MHVLSRRLPSVISNVISSHTGTGRIQNELQMSMEFDDLSIDAVVFIAFLESALMQFPMSDIGNVHCWLAKIPSPVLDAFGRAINDTSFLYFEHMDISTSESRLNIECVSCSSPMFEFMTEALKLRSAVDDLTDAVNDVLDWVVDILSGDFSQIQIILLPILQFYYGMSHELYS